jgi:hypothetical protein
MNALFQRAGLASRSALLIIFCASALCAADIPALVRTTKPAVVELFCYDDDGELVKTGAGFFHLA